MCVMTSGVQGEVESNAGVEHVGVGTEKNPCMKDEICQETNMKSDLVHLCSKRNYFWCPVMDCTSGPVQKVTQHLQKVHMMDAPTAAKVAKQK